MDFSKGKFLVTKGSTPSERTKGVILGTDLADFLKVDVGDSVVFLGQGFHGMSANGLYPVSGIVQLANPILNRSTAFIDLSDAQYLFATENRITSLVVDIEPDMDLEAMTREIRSNVDTSKYEVMNWQELMPELVQTIQADSAGGILMAGILYIVISFSLLGTFIMLAAERKREYGMLVGLGMRRTQLMIISFYEALFLALIGSAVTVLVTRPIGIYYYHHPIQLTGQAMDAMREMGVDAAMQFSMDWSIPLFHGALLVLLTLLISGYGLLVIRKLDPVKAMRS